MKKVTLLSLVLVLCLASVGIGYAYWSDKLFVDGTVSTGNVELVWGTPTWECDDDKDASSVVADVDGKTLVITVADAYPCITYTVNFSIICTGTVPVHFEDFVVLDGTTLPAVAYSVAYTNAALFDPEPADGILQLHQTEILTGTVTIHFDNEDNLEQSSSYRLFLGLEYGQWNEYPGLDG